MQPSRVILVAARGQPPRQLLAIAVVLSELPGRLEHVLLRRRHLQQVQEVLLAQELIHARRSLPCTEDAGIRAGDALQIYVIIIHDVCRAARGQQRPPFCV